MSDVSVETTNGWPFTLEAFAGVAGARRHLDEEDVMGLCAALSPRGLRPQLCNRDFHSRPISQSQWY
ncbi:hypothetical protein CTA1_10442 [Colletotrichum tanaceti]|uniref:Uncharacterized protein n=1 Tax=Colletotrichum tanaceti TaxID=1306861 RepID=A0A4U6XUX5_9PEZI|nr:hypothetical protein CTA1_10442 [Colletotrichum tanaceti]